MTTNNLQNKLNNADSYVSMALGLAVVLVLGMFIFNFTSRNQTGTTESGEQTDQTGQSGEQRSHTVVEGDTLWSISEQYYNTGYNWQEIQKANNLTDENQVVSGQTLIIPAVTPVASDASAPEAPVAQSETETPTEAPVVPTEEATPTAAVATATIAPEISPEAQATVAPQQTLGDKEYTIVKGDSLWKIAEAQYGSGYKWVEIARANEIPNPDLIYTGNTLRLP